jgi:hypothetical protein
MIDLLNQHKTLYTEMIIRMKILLKITLQKLNPLSNIKIYCIKILNY